MARQLRTGRVLTGFLGITSAGRGSGEHLLGMAGGDGGVEKWLLFDCYSLGGFRAAALC